MGYIVWIARAIAFEVAIRLPSLRTQNWACSECLDLDMDSHRLW